jgi:hypothetical protein
MIETSIRCSLFAYCPTNRSSVAGTPVHTLWGAGPSGRGRAVSSRSAGAVMVGLGRQRRPAIAGTDLARLPRSVARIGRWLHSCQPVPPRRRRGGSARMVGAGGAAGPGRPTGSREPAVGTAPAAEARPRAMAGVAAGAATAVSFGLHLDDQGCGAAPARDHPARRGAGQPRPRRHHRCRDIDAGFHVRPMNHTMAQNEPRTAKSRTRTPAPWCRPTRGGLRPRLHTSSSEDRPMTQPGVS